MKAFNLNLGMWCKSTECCNCGETIIMSSQAYDKLLESGKSFYCIKGHSQYFTTGQTKESKLKKQLEAEKKTVEH